MPEVNVEIVKQKIVTANITVPRKSLKNLEVSIECRTKIKAPRNENDRSILLDMELKVDAKNDGLMIEFDSDTVFELDQKPDDYNIVAEQKLIPLAREALFKKLDEILVSMGYKEMKLAEKM